jgi:chemotaxis protein methyltransferase CheR
MVFTNYFRNTQSLQPLVEQALPAFYDQGSIQIWNPGCSHGPGPHALAILLREQMPDDVFRNLHILATDADPELGPRLDSGIFSEQEVKRLPYPIRYRYFQVTDEPGYVQAVGEIRAKVSFARHDLMSLRPISEDFDLIVCKDVMHEYDEVQRRLVFRLFHRALRPGGLMATEHTQKMLEGLNQLFEPLARCSQVFRRLDAFETLHTHFNGSHSPMERLRKGILGAQRVY